uniref:Ig-like domain-containing protein n=1 Tax=Oryzias latipes TaxID=8090 RepID=A0A3P9ME36_ORYLA
MLELKSCCVLSVLHSVPDLLKPLKDELMALEGDTVTLSCKYSGSVYNVQWYQQKLSSTPQFIMADFSEKTEKFSVKHDKQKQEFQVQISSAAVTDSAVYYCAVRPTVTGNNKTLYKNLKTQYYTTSTRGHESTDFWLLRLEELHRDGYQSFWFSVGFCSDLTEKSFDHECMSS